MKPAPTTRSRRRARCIGIAAIVLLGSACDAPEEYEEVELRSLQTVAELDGVNYDGYRKPADLLNMLDNCDVHVEVHGPNGTHTFENPYLARATENPRSGNGVTWDYQHIQFRLDPGGYAFFDSRGITRPDARPGQAPEQLYIELNGYAHLGAPADAPLHNRTNWSAYVIQCYDGCNGGSDYDFELWDGHMEIRTDCS